MDETPSTLPIVLMLLLLFGGSGAYVILRRSLKAHPADPAAADAAMAARSLSTRQFGLLAGLLLLFHVLAGFTGRFVYEEQLPAARLIAQWVIYGLFTASLLLIPRPRRRRFGLTGGSIRWLPIGFGVYFAVVPFVFGLSFLSNAVYSLVTGADNALQDVARMMQGELTGLRLAYMLTAVLGAPVYEELIFRGLLFPFILKRGGRRTALAFTAVLFAAAHMHIPALLPIAGLSVILCLAYLRTASLWTCIGIHMMFNTIAVFVLNTMG